MFDRISIYVHKDAQQERPVERLMALGEKRDRSANYLAIEAIMQYLEREEALE